MLFLSSSQGRFTTKFINFTLRLQAPALQHSIGKTLRDCHSQLSHSPKRAACQIACTKFNWHLLGQQHQLTSSLTEPQPLMHLLSTIVSIFCVKRLETKHPL